jgi:hypothetical protein
LGSATQPLRLGCLASGQQLFGTQDRLIGFAALDTNLSVAQMDGIFDAIKPRFPGMT